MAIDWTTLAFEVLNFGVLVLLLQRFLFKPVKRTLDQRRESIEKTQHEVERREAAADAQREQYEQRERELEVEATEQIEAAMLEGRERAAALVEEGREHARRMVANAEQQTAAARRRALEQLRGEVLSLASEAAARVVRHMDAPPIACAYARRAAHGFAELFTDQLPEQLHVEIGEGEDPEAIEAELRTVLGAAPRLELTVDPELVVGVRLRAEGHEVEASVSASLRHWYAEQIQQGMGTEAVA